MKSLLTAFALAAAALFFAVDTAEAKLPFSHGYHTRHANKGVGYGHNNNFCKPRLVSTCEVNRRRECRTGYDHCGKPYTYHVTVVTYRAHYSNGSTRTYTKVYS